MGDVRPANSLAIDKFQTDKDDFNEWVGLLESAVRVAHNTNDAVELQTLYKTWLPLKLDPEGRSVYNNIDLTPANNAPLSWDQIKEQLSTLLVNPQEKYNWLSNRTILTWDGKESFHALATRVKRNVDKFDPECNKKQEYFFRFRGALPPDFRKAIDLGCRDESHETIDEAKRIAYRFLNTLNDDAPVVQTTVGEKQVAFTGASMSDDRLKSLEMSVQTMAIKVDGIDSRVKKVEDGRLRGARSRRHSQNEERHEKRRSKSRDGRDRDGRHDQRDRRSYRSSSDEEQECSDSDTDLE